MTGCAYLTGKIAVVTGSRSGVGRLRPRSYLCVLTRPEQAEPAVRETVERHDGVDVVANIAGRGAQFKPRGAIDYGAG